MKMATKDFTPSQFRMDGSGVVGHFWAGLAALLVLAASLALLWFGWRGGDTLKLILGAIFAALAGELGLRAVMRIFGDDARFTLSESGFVYHGRWRDIELPWDEVEGFWLNSIEDVFVTFIVHRHGRRAPLQMDATWLEPPARELVRAFERATGLVEKRAKLY